MMVRSIRETPIREFTPAATTAVKEPISDPLLLIRGSETNYQAPPGWYTPTIPGAVHQPGPNEHQLLVFL
jgi:hypothetical protein